MMDAQNFNLTVYWKIPPVLLYVSFRMSLPSFMTN